MTSSLRILCCAALTVNVGCDKPTHERIDEWVSTQKGPDKLRRALTDDALDVDLVAHAGINLIGMGDPKSVLAALNAAPPARRLAVASKLAPRLWERARIDGAMAVPTGTQVGAKDALWDLRGLVTGDVQRAIDGYLTDWFTGGYYEGRAVTGRYQGAVVVRELGPAAGDELVKLANEIATKPAVDKKRAAIGDELLLGMAVSGSPKAVARIFDLMNMDLQDPTLTGRAMTALHRAYVNPAGQFQAATPTPLLPHLDALAAMTRTTANETSLRNDALELIRVAGTPHCVQTLVGLLSERNIELRLVAANSALKCGGAAAIGPVLNALPDGAYEHRLLGDTVWKEIARATPVDEVKVLLRRALAGRTVQRWIAMEALGAMNSREDQARIAALANDSAGLRGYWTPGAGQKDPSVGKRAKEIAAALR